jgi:hypothetical protein
MLPCVNSLTAQILLWQTLDGRETRTSITFSLQPEFGMGMVAPQGTEEAEGGAARRTLHMSPVRKVQLEGDELFAHQVHNPYKLTALLTTS